MPRKRFRRMAVACLGLIGAILLGPVPVHAEDGASPPEMAIGAHHPTSREEHGSRNRAAGSSSGGMWFATAGIAVVLMAFGGMSLAAKKFKVGGDAGPLKVIGRTTLSPKHAVYLLKAGDRVLIIGAGSQGAPTLLGELSGTTSVDRPTGGGA